MSAIRKQYFARLVIRIVIFIVCLVMCFKPHFYDILEEMKFFDGFHILHILWLIWVFDMILQIIPIKNKVALGSQKLFANRFKPISKKINYKVLKNYIKNSVTKTPFVHFFEKGRRKAFCCALFCVLLEATEKQISLFYHITLVMSLY